MASIDSLAAASLQHILTVILIVTPLGAILLPFVGILIFFMPTESKRRPVFLLNVVACFLGICQAIYFASLHTYVVLHPNKPVSHTAAIAAIVILLMPPIIVDSILLFRLFAFYPLQLTSRNTLLAILAPTLVCKAARLACLIALIVTYPVAQLDGPSYARLPHLVWGHGPWIIIIFSLQVVDNSYMSVMFLYKLYCYGYHTRKELGGSSSRNITATIFTIALGNCVIPLVVDVVVIILRVFLPGWSSGAYVLLISNFVTIIGIVFATVWATNQTWITRHMEQFNITVDARTQSTVHFPAGSIASAISLAACDPYHDVVDLLSLSASPTSHSIPQGDSSPSESIHHV